jgi:hypothetical protein
MYAPSEKIRILDFRSQQQFCDFATALVTLPKQMFSIVFVRFLATARAHTVILRDAPSIQTVQILAV